VATLRTKFDAWRATNPCPVVDAGAPDGSSAEIDGAIGPADASSVTDQSATDQAAGAETSSTSTSDDASSTPASTGDASSDGGCHASRRGETRTAGALWMTALLVFCSRRQNQKKDPGERSKAG
jgi:hypothetical protein